MPNLLSPIYQNLQSNIEREYLKAKISTLEQQYNNLFGDFVKTNKELDEQKKETQVGSNSKNFLILL